MMRPAGLAVWKAHQLVREVVQPGVTTDEIDQVVRDFFQRIDAEPLFLDYPNSTAGRPPFPGVTCISINEQVVHGIPGPRKLVEGDVVSIDTGCRIRGWCGDAAVTLPVGEVKPEVQHLLDVTAEVLVLAIDLIPQKAKWSEVAKEMDAFVKDAGFSTVENFVGHGIGQKMHEPPQVPNYVGKKLRSKDDFRLDEGLVIAIEPMVNMGRKKVVAEPDFWTMSTADGKPSAHFEHTVAITSAGVRVLTAPPLDDNDAEIVTSL